MLGRKLVLLLLSFIPLLGFTQSEEWLEQQTEANPDWVIDEEVIQNLNDIKKNPLNLNTCREEDLLLIPGIDPRLVQEILNHRERSGNFQSVYELQVLPSMHPRLFLLYQGLFSVGDTYVFSDTRKSEYLLFVQPQLQTRAGYADGRIIGPPVRHWHRLSSQISAKWKLGLSLENDAGERFRWDKNQKGFDFGTFYLAYHHPKKRSKWIIGDYRVLSGQGLVHGSMGSFGAASWVGRVYRAEQARGYRSADESRFLRGVLMEKGRGNVMMRLFVSSLRSDGISNEEGQSESGTGLHRTETELAKRKSYHRQLLGHSIQYRSNQGFLLSFQQLWVHEGAGIRHYYGLSHRFYYRSLMIFGEWAHGSDGFSALQSLVFNPNKNIDISLLYRQYPTQNTNPFASGFSEFSRPENERGLYFSTEYRESSKRIWRAYADWAFRPMPSYMVNAPYWKQSLFLESEEKWGAMKFRIRYQYRSGERNIPSEEARYKEVLPYQMQGIRLQWEGVEDKTWQLRNRLEINQYQYNQQKDRGFLFFQEVHYRPRLKPYYFILRYTRFYTPDYQVRVYAYESDVLYAFSIPAFSGRGQRVYAVARFPLLRGLDAWIKMGVTVYQDKQSVGSGLEQIDSNHIWDSRVLLRYSW